MTAGWEERSLHVLEIYPEARYELGMKLSECQGVGHSGAKIWGRLWGLTLGPMGKSGRVQLSLNTV